MAQAAGLLLRQALGRPDDARHRPLCFRRVAAPALLAQKASRGPALGAPGEDAQGEVQAATFPLWVLKSSNGFLTKLSQGNSNQSIPHQILPSEHNVNSGQPCLPHPWPFVHFTDIRATSELQFSVAVSMSRRPRASKSAVNLPVFRLPVTPGSTRSHVSPEP